MKYKIHSKCQSSREICLKVLQMYEVYIEFIDKISNAKKTFLERLENIGKEMEFSESANYLNLDKFKGMEALSESIMNAERSRLCPNLLMKQFEQICSKVQHLVSKDLAIQRFLKDEENRTLPVELLGIAKEHPCEMISDIYSIWNEDYCNAFSLYKTEFETLTMKTLQSFGILSIAFPDVPGFEIDSLLRNSSKLEDDPLKLIYSKIPKDCVFERISSKFQFLHHGKDIITFNEKSFSPSDKQKFSNTHSILTKYDGLGIPNLVLDCTKYLFEKGLKEEGLFSCGARKEDIVKIFNSYADFGFFDLSTVNDPHVVAGALKYWLRESKTMFSNHTLYQLHKLLPFENPESPEKLEMTKLILKAMKTDNETNFYTLKIIVDLLFNVSLCYKDNKMNVLNLGKVTGISFFKGRIGMEGSASILQCFIKNFNLLFPDNFSIHSFDEFVI
jgi:hypothetical protein